MASGLEAQPCNKRPCCSISHMKALGIVRAYVCTGMYEGTPFE